jgi:outer membrane protein OmpA-like peptidoglycan-associated protein
MPIKFVCLLNLKCVYVAVLLVFISALTPDTSFAQQAHGDRVNGDSEASTSVTEPLGLSYQEPKSIKAKNARITLYRPRQGVVSGVASLEVNGRYHSALQLAAYTELCVSPGRFVVAARMAQVGLDPKGFRDATATMEIQESQNVYLRLLEQGDGRATITPVQPQVALAELQDTRRQIHVVSRALGTFECIEAPEEIIAKETLVLPADGVFGFGRSDIKGVSDEGRKSIDRVVEHIQKKYSNEKTTAIRVTGYTDPMGDPAFNKRLSEARAKTIQAYMTQHGIPAKQISSQGLGAEQLIIATCGKQATSENIDCNKPNRRVVFEIQKSGR